MKTIGLLSVAFFLVSGGLPIAIDGTALSLHIGHLI